MKRLSLLSAWLWGWLVFWLKQNAISFDQWGNTFFLFGNADETISARCWRLRDKPGWKQARRVIDALLWFDKNHCKESFASELRAKQLPALYQRIIADYVAGKRGRG